MEQTALRDRCGVDAKAKKKLDKESKGRNSFLKRRHEEAKAERKRKKEEASAAKARERAHKGNASK